MGDEVAQRGSRVVRSKSVACEQAGGAMHLVYLPLSLLGTAVGALFAFQTYLLRSNTSTYMFLKVCGPGSACTLLVPICGVQ